MFCTPSNARLLTCSPQEMRGEEVCGERMPACFFRTSVCWRLVSLELADGGDATRVALGDLEGHQQDPVGVPDYYSCARSNSLHAEAARPCEQHNDRCGLPRCSSRVVAGCLSRRAPQHHVAMRRPCQDPTPAAASLTPSLDSSAPPLCPAALRLATSTSPSPANTSSRHALPEVRGCANCARLQSFMRFVTDGRCI